MKQILKNKKIVVVYNLKTNNYTDNYGDFFSKEEFNFILKQANSSKYPIDFIEGELAFIEQINYYFPLDIVVLNLTRRGSRNNKKSTVTAICDLKGILYIGSSTLTMNLCRNKFYLYPLLKQINVNYPITINKFSKNINNLIGKSCIIKNNASASSINLSNDSVKLLTKKIVNSITDDEIIQQYIEGYEIEVPFIIKNYKVEILATYMLVLNDTKFYSSLSKDKILDFENSDKFNYSLEEVVLNEKIKLQLVNIIQQVVNLLEIKNYGRIDFRTSNLNNINNYFIFDISTSPFFTKNSSFYFGMKSKNVFDQLMDTLI